MINATIHYQHNGLHRQKRISAETEEKLMHDTFMFKVDLFNHSERIDISYIDYAGRQLFWNEFAAHQHFAKGRLTFEEFKTLCTTANMSVARCN